MYETNEFDGALVTETDEGVQFWIALNDLLATLKENFSSVHYCLSPLFHEYGKFSEVFISWSGDESIWNVHCKGETTCLA